MYDNKFHKDNIHRQLNYEQKRLSFGMKSPIINNKTAQRISVAVLNNVKGRIGYDGAHYDGSPYVIKRFKKIEWICNNFKGISTDINFFIEDLNRFLNDDKQTIRDSIIHKYSMIDWDYVLKEYRRRSLTKDLYIPIVISQQSIGAEGYKSRILNSLGKDLNNKNTTGPHVSLMFKHKWLFVAINTPNSTGKERMNPNVLLNHVCNYIKKYTFDKVDEFSKIYITKIKQAVYDNRVVVISTPEKGKIGSTYLGSTHAEMLIADYLKSTDSSSMENSHKVTIATCMNPSYSSDMVKEILKNTKTNNPNEMRVIRFGGTLIDCRLCHLMFHGMQENMELKNARGSILHYDGNPATNIGINDTFDNYFKRFKNIILSSNKIGNWHPGWTLGKYAMEKVDRDKAVSKNGLRMEEHKLRMEEHKKEHESNNPMKSKKRGRKNGEAEFGTQGKKIKLGSKSPSLIDYDREDHIKT